MTEKSPSMPIAVFDSGVGGLTVLRSLAQAFPKEDFIYLGDTARLPYGTKSPVTIRQYVEQNIRFLLGRRVKAIVVACNSASSVLDPSVKAPVPIYNVIDPGAIAAVSASQSGKIGVIATRTTVAQQAYVKAIHVLDPTAEVYQQACPLLVPLVEEGWVDDPLANLVVHRYLSPIKNSGVDTLIMGCTHYPVLREAMGKVMGQDVTLVDSGEAIAQLMDQDIKNKRLLPNPIGQGRLDLLSTDMAENFRLMAERILHPLAPASFTHVDL
ncbi:MAG: glutamate racemase [Bdellovibrionaceae bacterium]|nr:glutamate racemase [Bdellovibrionales bacterium]MCB9083424.1 glutamate racemase [Pseudobdellovibrionaceae bacterium]